MDERDKDQLEQTENSGEEIVVPPKRGRGRPKNEEQEVPVATENQEEGELTDQPESVDEGESPSGDTNRGEKQTRDYSFSEKGTQIIAELVKSQNEAQANMIRAQTEFSNQVMDRMDNYRMQMAALQNEISEKEKTRLRADFISAQDKLDEYQEKIQKLRNQLDIVNRKNMKLTNRVEALTVENESFRQQVKTLKEQWDALEKQEPKPPSMQEQEPVVSFPKEGWLKRRQRKRFLKKVLEGEDFSDEQKEVIRKADAGGLPFERLVQICNPSIPPANMERMITYSKG